MHNYKNAIALIDEGLEVFTNLIDSVTRHGNYSAESTCTFIDQGAAAVRDARALLSALAPVEPEPVAWQWRLRTIDGNMSDWRVSETKHSGLMPNGHPLEDFEQRPLYASPAPTPTEADDLVARDEREALILKYALATKRNAHEMAGIPLTIVCQHFREFADEVIAPRNERTRAGGKP